MFIMRPSYISVRAAYEEHGTSFDCFEPSGPRFFTFPLPPRQRSPRVSHPAERAAERADGARDGGAAGGERSSLETLPVPCTAPSTTRLTVPSAALVAATWCHSASLRRVDELISRRDLYSEAQLEPPLGAGHSAGG